MKFVVTNNEVYEDARPCEEAKLEELVVIQSTSKVHQPKYRSNWFVEGFEHWEGVDDNKPWLYRKVFKQLWTVEFNSLEELLAFQAKYGLACEISAKSYKASYGSDLPGIDLINYAYV